MSTTIQRDLAAAGDQRHMHDVHKIAHRGGVDADGHILEPPDLWQEYLENRYKDRALRIEIEPERGLEVFMIDNQRSKLARPGMVSTLGAMGAADLPDIMFNPDRTYVGEIPFGAMDPDQRIQLLDAEGLDIAILYTTVGLLWEAELEDPELSQAYTRAYNRWICDFTRDHSDRLIPTAHLSLTDPEAAAAEAAARRGRRGEGVLRSAVHPQLPPARPSRSRPGVRSRAGPRRAVRHPPHLRAAVDQGNPHGNVGARARTCGSPRR